ncbi:hypothetical protein JAAARDRAFT_614036 [Jaapia argillacea MUCL 33604]|uniref:Protein kinase domain-containing protein n=1 Tax=Jaapia argillacea MUCL 33604 TaxID=933084 RepID=A0A067PG29_9AGAM|nr:hypothetical protein JAAARDRAFT_614036 [Jaapia argillacea MUCL 33604]
MVLELSDFVQASMFSKMEKIDVTSVNRVILDVAKGLEYLHEQGIFHGDISGTNVLVTSEHRGKLCNFGLTRLFTDPNSVLYVTASLAQGGTMVYLAPELLLKKDGLDGKATDAGDIYAFSMLSWELYARKPPFSDVLPNDLVEHVASGERPPILNPRTSPGVRAMPGFLPDVLKRCWSDEPEYRPEASQVVRWLERQFAPVSGGRR